MNKTFSTYQEKKPWHGVDRKSISWFPKINEELCNGCGLCLLTCGNAVFKWNMTQNRPVVTVEQNCVPGCTTCGKVCPESAITFPEDPKKFLRGVAIKYKIYPNVKQELAERMAKFPNHLLNATGGNKDGK
ncbi:MAG: 4Fe-4S binding protein [Thermoplasmatales archaeon]